MKKALFSIAFALVAFAAVEAQTNLEFPIAELGNCASEESCRAYCDNSANMDRCLDFAEKNGMMDQSEIDEARKFASIGEGPGGCASREACESYCDNAANIRECIAFAEKNGFMSGEELAEAKQIMKALDSGASLPGGCTNEESCDEYCAEGANVLECVAFAEAAGFITPEEAAMVKKTGGKGPGGCWGEECEKFCQDQNNAEICFNFAKEYGLLTPEMQKGSDEFLETLRNAPAEVKTCMESSFGDVSKIFPGPATGAKLRECFEAFKNANPDAAFWPAEQGEQRTGPGGCRNREECDAYCTANPEACRPDGSEPSRDGRPPQYQGESQNQYPGGSMQYQGQYQGGPGEGRLEYQVQYQNESGREQFEYQGEYRGSETEPYIPGDTRVEEGSPDDAGETRETESSDSAGPTSQLDRMVANVLSGIADLFR